MLTRDHEPSVIGSWCKLRFFRKALSHPRSNSAYSTKLSRVLLSSRLNGDLALNLALFVYLIGPEPL